MADDDYGPAQPIADVVKGVYKKANDLYTHLTGSTVDNDNVTKPAISKPDDSWHKQMLENANKSYMPTQTMAQKKAVTPAKTTVKVVTKSMPRKK